MLTRADDIERFVTSARPGDRATYGRGERPPAELVRAMQHHVDAGVLQPVSKREGGGFLFMVQRGLGKPRAPGPRLALRRVRKTATGMVFDCLVRAARRGAPCPTNEELAVRCGLSGERAARYRVRRLAEAGRIAIAQGGPCGRRVVTIRHGPHAGRRTMTIEEPPEQRRSGDPDGG